MCYEKRDTEQARACFERDQRGEKMAEYIEREALQEALQRKKSGVADRRYTEGWNDCLLRVKSMVHSAKAADVAPMVRSKWKYFYKQGKAVCTNCSFERSVDDNFGRAVACPNCGARMDGE